MFAPNVGSLLRRASVKCSYNGKLGNSLLYSKRQHGRRSLSTHLHGKERKHNSCMQSVHSDALTLNGPPPCS